MPSLWMSRVGSRQRKGWSRLLICRHSQTWAALVLMPLPDTNGRVRTEGRSFGQPGGFQSPQIQVASPYPSPAQATVHGLRRLTRKKAKSTQKRFGGGEPVAKCSEGRAGKSGSQSQEGRSCPCSRGLKQGRRAFIFLCELQTLASFSLATAYAFICFP